MRSLPDQAGGDWARISRVPAKVRDRPLRRLQSESWASELLALSRLFLELPNSACRRLDQGVTTTADFELQTVDPSTLDPHTRKLAVLRTPRAPELLFH